MKILVGIPTLSRADLLIRNKAFLEGVCGRDSVLLIDNGDQEIDIDVPILRPGRNLGVAASWNCLLRAAFIDGDFDGLVLLQDDIIWSDAQLEAAHALLSSRPDVDLLLSFMQFSVQVHRRSNIHTVGFYDERFSPAWCEDDDYALTMTARRRVYRRFAQLDPLLGSITNGTPKRIPWERNRRWLEIKWGFPFGVNAPGAIYYESNAGLMLHNMKN